jgi:hypothetical protein
MEQKVMADAHPVVSQNKARRRISNGVYFILGGIGTTIVATIIGIVTTAYVEISFKGLSTETLKNPSKWMDFHIDLVRPEAFHAYYGDNDGGHSALRDASFNLRFFELTKKVLGEKIRPDGYSFSIVGFWKEERIVLDHRGNANGGEGVYVLKSFQIPEISARIFAGYVLPEDWKQTGGSDDWTIKCPFLMLPEDVAQRRYGDRAVLLRDFPFLATKCSEFPMPKSLAETIPVSPSIDDILNNTKH